jgi:hypothetical protein
VCSSDLTGANTVSGRNITVPYTLGGAASPDDYSISPAGQQVIIPAGSSSAMISISALADWLVESSETLILKMGTVQNAEKGAAGTEDTFTLTILDRTVPPRVAFTTATQSVQEAVAVMPLVTLQLLHPTNNSPLPANVPIQVPIQVSGKAKFGEDYSLHVNGSPVVLSGGGFIATFPVGSQTLNIRMDIVNDTVYEGEEEAVFTLGAPDHAVLAGSPNYTVHTVRIQDDDPPDCARIYTMTRPMVNSTDQKISLSIRNGNQSSAYIAALTIEWINQTNARLKTILLDNPIIWTGPSNGQRGPVTIPAGSWNSSQADRTIAANTEKQLVFMFSNTQVTNWSKIFVTLIDEWGGNCTISPPK